MPPATCLIRLDKGNLDILGPPENTRSLTLSVQDMGNKLTSKDTDSSPEDRRKSDLSTRWAPSHGAVGAKIP